MANFTKEMLERFILDILEMSSSFCMDQADEREALADALTCDLLGRFEIKPKDILNSHAFLARIFDSEHFKKRPRLQLVPPEE